MSSYNDFDHQGSDYYFPARGFLTPPPARRMRRCSPAMPASDTKPGRSSPQPKADPFRVIHKVPSGDSPYVRAKHVQLIDKDPSRAISLFWAAINSGDRVDSALKDMAVVMKQLDRSDEAIEAIKSFRHFCPPDSQESLDNILLELYKQSGRTEEEIQMLQIKLMRVEEGMAFGGKRTKMARSQGKKVQVTVEKEYSRLLGNLAWAYMQQKDFKSAEENYRKALSLESDKNKQCNLAICLMHLNKLTEARFLLQAIRVSSENGGYMDESYAKSYDRASQLLDEFQSQQGHVNTKKPFSDLQSSSPLPSGIDRAFTELPYQKRADFDWRRNGHKLHKCQEASKIAYESPFLGRAIPKVPFTQPRRCSSPPGGQSKSTFCRKLTFGSFVGSAHARTMKKSEKGMNLDTHSVLGSSDATENGKSDLKMSWVDMVEEDEKKFGKLRNNAWTKSADQLSFDQDENRDSNIIPETPNRSMDRAEIDIGSGYLTQPEKAAALSTNQTIRRSLCFDESRQLGSGSISSPLSTKVLNFEDNGLMLLSPDFGSNKSVKRRNRLQVFQDITTQQD